MPSDSAHQPTYDELARELHECRSVLNAIRSGKVDTLFGQGDSGPAVYKIKSEEFEQENARLIARLEDLSRRKSEFVAGISHELRSPLAAAREFIALAVESEGLAPKLKRSLVLANRNIARLARIIDDLLYLSRLEAGQSILIRPGVVAPTDLVQEAMSTVGPLAEAKRVRVITDVERSGAVFGDLHRLTQVLVNLLVNAVKFTPPGQAVELGADGSRQDGFVRFQVVDSGPGIPVADLTHVFERYYQVSTPDQPGRGAGLGLAVARDIIQAHRGEVSVESPPGEGATFWFTVPLCNNMIQRALVLVEAALREAEQALAVLLVSCPPGGAQLDPGTIHAALDSVLQPLVPNGDDLVMLSGTSGLLVQHADRAEAMRVARRIESRLSEALGREAPIDVTVLAWPGDVDEPAQLTAHLERRLGVIGREVRSG